ESATGAISGPATRGWLQIISILRRKPALRIPIGKRFDSLASISTPRGGFMRPLPLIAILLVASRSTAQPVAPEIAGPGTCEVTIVRAPDDVRQEIEGW